MASPCFANGLRREEIKALPAKYSQLSLVRLASPVLAKGSPSATEQALRGVQMSCKGAAARRIPPGPPRRCGAGRKRRLCDGGNTHAEICFGGRVGRCL